MEREIDVIEEIARVYGYDKFPNTLPAFTGLIQKGNFVNAVIAPTETKAEAIKAALLSEPPGFIRYRVEVVDDLGELLVHRGRFRPAKPTRDEAEKPKPEQPTGQEASG